MTKLESIDQLESFLDKNPISIILKHSTACPISAGAYREFSELDTDPPVPLAIVFILDTRSVSNHLTEITGVQHKSPQALFFRNGECYHDLSHYEITVDNMKQALEA